MPEQSPLGQVTDSIGIAVLNADCQLSSEQLLLMADEALYRAKAGGRNRVKIANA